MLSSAMQQYPKGISWDEYNKIIIAYWSSKPFCKEIQILDNYFHIRYR